MLTKVKTVRIHKTPIRHICSNAYIDPRYNNNTLFPCERNIKSLSLINSHEEALHKTGSSLSDKGRSNNYNNYDNAFQQKRISDISNTELPMTSVNEMCILLGEQLHKIHPGNKDATNYHRTIVEILELIFYPHLCYPTIEHKIHEGRKRIDILFDNCAESGFFFRLYNTHGIPSRFIIVECKNYTCDIANPELDQISGRFSRSRGKTGIITCRAIDDMQMLICRCNDVYKDDRGLILPLDDEDFYNLLQYKAEGLEHKIDEYIQKRFHMIASI